MNDVILDVRKLNTTVAMDGERIPIVRDVSFQLRKGETLALVGESGCGKTMTMQSVVRLLPKNAEVRAEQILYRSFRSGTPVETRIDRLSGRSRQMRALRGREISMVFQDPMASLNPVYRVGDQITEGLLEHERGMKKPEARAKALELLKKLGIPAAEERVNAYPHQLSGGMKQRVVIAIAMICDPEIIIADEPTTALDVTIQSQIMELLQELKRDWHKSIILITHNMGLVAEIADQVAVMYMGRIVEYGSAQSVFESPLHPYTRGLLRSVPVLGMDREKELQTIPGNTPDTRDSAPGCAFQDRCEECEDSCRTGRIPAFGAGGEGFIRCCYATDINKIKIAMERLAQLVKEKTGK